ncbi:ankyrin repeat domain-containing protein [Candidatus Dependentiae bacterium]|nr:ankyrin repeat domain-containing protein [Candidatus Dependentiae bacterium]
MFSAVAQDDSIAVKKLLKNGLSMHCKDKLGNTLLHKAFYYKSKKVIHLLLSISHGTCNLNAKNNYGLTPLEIAVSTTEHFEFLKELLEQLQAGPQPAYPQNKWNLFCTIQ